MSVQGDIQFYYRRAAEARARGKEALAQTMENYARNLEAGIYNDDGRGFDMGASNQRWAQKEAEEAARRKAAEEQLYASRPRRSSGGGSRQSAPSYNNIQNGDYYDRPKYSNGSVGDFRRMDETAGYYDRPKTGPGYTAPPEDYPVVEDGGYGSNRKRERSNSGDSWLNKPLW